MRKRLRRSVSTGDLLTDAASGLAARYRKAEHIARSNAQFQQALPSDLARNTCLINIRGNVAVLGTANASWGSRLRLHRSRILNALGRSCKTTIADFKVKVMPELFEQTVSPSAIRPTSESSRKAMASAAKGLMDPDLANRLARLAKKS